LIEIIWLRKYLFVKVYLVDYGRNYYAMKVLRKNIVLEGQDLAYVMLERDVLIQSQSNPFIIQLIYAFQNAERLFFLMEVAKGGNFYRLLIKQAPRPFRYERIVFHSGEIACALSFLHSKRIVCLESSLKLFLFVYYS
jgi:serine/threonine protein kinase